jgi:hypothetical protein
MQQISGEGACQVGEGWQEAMAASDSRSAWIAGRRHGLSGKLFSLNRGHEPDIELNSIQWLNPE